MAYVARTCCSSARGDQRHRSHPELSRFISLAFCFVGPFFLTMVESIHAGWTREQVAEHEENFDPTDHGHDPHPAPAAAMGTRDTRDIRGAW